MKNQTPTYSSKVANSNFLNDDAKLTVNGTTISVEIADTPESRRQGLSGKERIADNEGMLFTSDVPSIPTFWMKDMKFPLDFIWIHGNKVVDLSKDIPNPVTETPDTDLPLYKPKAPVDQVLEVNAGFIEKNGIEIGDMVERIN